ncbi:L-type lectin-domain containing receptor kinase IX.1-like [Gastrolobium bilobum]|uniref:L-type lectin-domain containing receptor kinase IX.1-like n=1 Tax=Gastrolobium bilobum TaxID=150636 RepID=UPI002AB0313C|nr:L-type lectin-domain containing receptor kinase IX.1-like [Gastrolobium bilobum]
MACCGLHFGHHATSYVRGTLLFLLIIPLVHAQLVSFDYQNFVNADLQQQQQLKLEGDASVSDCTIQLTSGNWIGSVGRVTSSNLIQLWNETSNQQKDFTTEFSFIVFSNQNYYGEGLAFFLASPNLPDANDTEIKRGGLGLGRVHDKTPLPIDYKFVAVEFDTNSNQWDPTSLHVGVDVNSMQSNILRKWGTDISRRSVYDCSIVYNSRDKILDVSFTGYILDLPVTKYLSYHIDITEHLPESVIVGISAATGANPEEHTLLSWSFSTSNADPKKERNTKLLEGIGIGVGLSVTLVGLVHILLWMMDKGKGKESPSETTSDYNMDDEFHISTGPKKISYNELVTATNNFADTQKLGKGGFGCVYKGYFKDSNSYVAIKRISAESRQGIKEYAAEVKIISQLRHRNLVQLIGWCHKKNDLLLIYEYMPNGSLDSHLFHGESILWWQVRYNIALGLASALLYLQEGWEKCVLHRDIKSSNIMLDSNFNAKLGDFGLAKQVDHEKGSQTTDVAGTIGYLGPEYMKTGKARKESDIFSFGIVLLEIASGREATNNNDKEGQVLLVEWVWELYGLRNLLAAADPKLCGVLDVQQMECLLVVGLWCANPDYISRPSIRQVIKVLNFEVPLPILPQKIPVVIYLPPTTY